MSEKNIKTGFNSFKIILIFVLLCAAILNYPYIFTPSVWSDESLYCWFGKQLSLHPSLVFSNEITSWHPPLFSVFLAIAHWVNPSFMTYHLVPFLFYLTGIIAVYYLGKLLRNSFTGVIAAILLAFNASYFNISTRILIDVPLMVFCTILALFLFRIDEKSPLKNHIMVGAWGALTVILKWSGIMIVPWIFIFYMLSLQTLPLRKRIDKFLIPLLIIFVVILLLCIKNYFQLGTIKPYGPPIGSGYSHLGNNLIQLLKLNYPSFYVFFVMGILNLRKKSAHLLLTWAIIFILSILSIERNESRFNLLILPPVLIIIGIGMDSILDLLNQKLIRMESLKLFFTIVMFIFYLSLLFSFLPKIDVSHCKCTGYEQAGSYIQKAATDSTLILAGSERQIRYFSGIDFKDYGGLIVPFRQSLPEFKKLLKKTTGPIILEVDTWEPLQPVWIFSQISDKELARDGFKLTRTIWSHVNIYSMNRTFPVICIYERPGR